MTAYTYHYMRGVTIYEHQYIHLTFACLPFYIKLAFKRRLNMSLLWNSQVESIRSKSTAQDFLQEYTAVVKLN